MSQRYLDGIYWMYEWYVKCLNVSEGKVRTSQVRTSPVRTGQVRTDQVRSDQVSTGQVSTGQVRNVQVKEGQDRTGQVRTALEIGVQLYLDCMKKRNHGSLYLFFTLSRLSLFSRFLFNQMGKECSDQKFLLQ